MPTIRYRFRFSDGTEKMIATSRTDTHAPPPAWTALDFHQCPHCPLKPDSSPQCPMALSMVPLVEAFADRQSFESVDVEVQTSERTLNTRTSTQRAIGSIMGLLAGTSNCPRTFFLQPMAHFHLPFANEEETIYRVTSMYLLAQFFVERQGGDADWSMLKLKRHYEELQQVNLAMADRLRAACSADGTLNALTLLDLLAKALPDSIDKTLLELRPLFDQYLSDKVPSVST